MASGSIDPAAVVSGTNGVEEAADALAALTAFETSGVPVIDEL